MAGVTHERIPKAARKAPGIRCRKDYMPIGTVVIRADHDGTGRRLTRFIKVNDDYPTGKRWIQYARWWWEKNKGPVPNGLMVLRKDGDTMNDDPSNLMLGTPGMKLKLAHQRDPEMSARNRVSAGTGTAEFNRLRGRLHRLEEFLGLYWYPVLDKESVILNVPFRRRKTMLDWFRVGVSNYPKNGKAKKAVSRFVQTTGIRPVRGLEFRNEHYQVYMTLDPEHEIPARRSVDVDGIKEKLQNLAHTEIWKRAVEAAKLDLSERG